MVADLSASLTEAMPSATSKQLGSAHAAIGQLLATAPRTGGAEVVDLAKHRGRDPKPTK